MVDTINHGGDIARAAKILECLVVTPEATALQRPAQFVVLPLEDGEIGIAPGRSPLIGRLGYGEMRITEGGRTDHYYVDGGFVQVAGNVVSVLTGRAVPVSELDASAAAERLKESASQQAHSLEAAAVRDRAAAQARAQLRLAARNK